MSKEKKILDILSNMPPMVIETAYLYAINYILYGLDVTKEWLTATQNTSALEKAYSKGYYEGRSMASEEKKQIYCSATMDDMKKIIDKMYPDGIFKESYIMAKEEFETFVVPEDLERVIGNGVPLQETVTEFADRCRECGKMKTGH